VQEPADESHWLDYVRASKSSAKTRLQQKANVSASRREFIEIKSELKKLGL